jgi:hypothetical protein
MPAEGLELLELGTGSLEAREDGEYVEWAGLKLPRPGASCPPAALQQALLKMARGPEFDCARYGTQVSPPSKERRRACGLKIGRALLVIGLCWAVCRGSAQHGGRLADS